MSIWSRVQERSEGPLFLAGLALVLLLLAELVIAWLIDPTLGRAMATGMTAEVFSGREGGIPIAIAGGVPPLLVWQLSVTQDVAFWCLLYPIFLVIYHERHGSGGFIMRRLERMERSARRNESFAKQWGPVGIFAFMLVPFLVNGPMVGSILGRLVGIRTRYLIAPVVLSTAVASAAWTFFFESTVGRLRDFDPTLAYIAATTVFVALMAAATTALIMDEQKHRQQMRRSAFVVDEEE